MNLNLEKKYHLDELTLSDCQIEGYASLFDVRDRQGDVMQRGAFANCLSKKTRFEVKMLWQHDPLLPIGVWTKLEEDAHGLRVEGEILTSVQAGAEALALLRAGAVNGLSIGYRTLASGKNNRAERNLKAVDLWEISLVTFPMLEEARATLVKSDTQAPLDKLAQACEALHQVLKDERI